MKAKQIREVFIITFLALGSYFSGSHFGSARLGFGVLMLAWVIMPENK